MREAQALITGGILQTGLGLAVACLLVRLYRLNRDLYLAYWAAAWLALSVYNLSGVGVLIHGVRPGLSLALGLMTVLLGYLQPPTLGLAAISLRGEPPSRGAHWGLLGGSLGAGLLSVAMTQVPGLDRAYAPAVAAGPSFLLVAAANLWFGWSFARFSPRARTVAGQVVIGFCLLYGLHQLLVAVSWSLLLTPYGNTVAGVSVGLLLPMGITTGIVLTVLDDVAERARSLSESEATNRALLDAIPDGLFALDREGVFRSFVPGSEFQPLLPPEQFIGRRVEDVFPEELADLQQERLRAAFDSRRIQAFEYSIPGAGGPRHYEARLVAVDEARAIGIVRDVTERHEGEAHREALIDELEAKNAELERFTYTVSHDLKTPLITIAAFAGFLQRDAQEGNHQQMTQDVGRVHEAVFRMKELLDDLLELSRIGRVIGEPETVPFDEVAHDAVARLGSLPADAGVEIVVASDLPSVTGDRRRLVEVVQNLLENAIHFKGDQPHPRIEVTTRGQDGELTLLIRDNGIGIDPRYHQRVFTLFEKLDPSSQGTGIGLAIVKRIVEVHGGRIWVESAGEGTGSTFCLTLPVAHPGPVPP